MRLLGKCVEVKRKRKVFQHPVPKRCELVATRVGSQPLDVLSLTPLTLRRSDEPTSPCVRSRRAVVAANEMEAQVDARRHARRRKDVAVVDEQAVGQHVDAGIATLQFRGQAPMGCRRTPVEEPGGSEGERPGADRYRSHQLVRRSRASAATVDTLALTSS